MKRVAIAMLALLHSPHVAHAQIVMTYTETAVGSGTFAGVAYTDQLITLTGIGSTSNITFGDSTYNLTLTTATVTVGSNGTATFTDPVNVFDNTSTTAAGFNQTFDILDTTNSAFGTYNLQGSIGPVSGLAILNYSDNFNTSLGVFSISSLESGFPTFSASVASVPEPSSFILLGLPLMLGFAWRYWRKHVRKDDGLTMPGAMTILHFS